MNHPARKVGGTINVQYQSDAGSGFDLIFKKDYVVIENHGCPECCRYPYQVVLPPLLGKVTVVAIFDNVGNCGRPMVEKLHQQGVVVVVDETAVIGFPGGRTGNIKAELPDTFEELLKTTRPAVAENSKTDPEQA